MKSDHILQDFSNEVVSQVFQSFRSYIKMRSRGKRMFLLQYFDVMVERYYNDQPISVGQMCDMLQHRSGDMTITPSCITEASRRLRKWSEAWHMLHSKNPFLFFRDCRCQLLLSTPKEDLATWIAERQRQKIRAESSAVTSHDKQGELHVITFYEWISKNDRDQDVTEPWAMNRWLAKCGHAIVVRQIVQSQSFTPPKGAGHGTTQISITVFYERKPEYTWS